MKNSRIRNWSVFFTLGSLAFGVRLAHAEKRVPTHVACVGDSITAGTGASSTAKNYPSVLQTLFGSQVQVKNFGHSGATMLSANFGNLPYQEQSEYTGSTAFVSGAGANAIVDVIIMLGANDSKPVNWTPAGKPKNDQQYLKDYRAMVDHYTALTPKPLVFLALPLATGSSPCCTISGTVIHDEIIPLIKQLASEKHLPTIDLNTPTTVHDSYFTDGVHPNDTGYALVAQVMHDGLLQDLAAAGGSGGAGGPGGSSGTAGASGSSASGGTAGISGAGPSGGSSGLADGAGAGGTPGIAASGGSGVGAAGATAGGASGAAGSAGGSVTSAGAPGNAGGSSGSNAPSPSGSDDSSGCAVAAGGNHGSLGAALGLLGLAWLGVRRRSARRMC